MQYEVSHVHVSYVLTGTNSNKFMMLSLETVMALIAFHSSSTALGEQYVQTATVR